MARGVPGAVAAALFLLLSGCLGDTSSRDVLPAPDLARLDLSWEDFGALLYAPDHDHTDRALHVETARGLAPLSFSTLSQDGRSLGWYTEADVERGLVAVGVVTGEGARDMRVVLLDEAALPELRVLGSFDEPRAYGDVKLDDELPLAYVPFASPVRFRADTSGVQQPSPQPAFSIWDITEPANAKRVGEAAGAGCHMLHPMHVAGTPYVWCAHAGGALAFRLERLPAGEWRGVALAASTPQSDPESARYLSYYDKLSPQYGPARVPTGLALLTTPHDMTAQPDPLTGQPVLVTAHELQGIRAYDVANPAAPRELGAWRGQGLDAAIERVHTVGLAKIGERRIAFGATETFTEVPPTLYVVDFTDWANPMHLATWNPPGIPSDEGIAYSMHNFQPVGTRLYVTQMHGGAWALDVSDPGNPTPVAHRLERRDTGYPRPTELVAPTTVPVNTNWYWDVVVARGYVLLTDVSTGVEVLQVDGDPAGEAAWRGFT